MFNDRDLMILGSGALLAVFCLFLPFSFTGKVVAGMLVLMGCMTIALLRLGPDRVPLEEWVLRRTRFWLGTRHFVFQRPGWKDRNPDFAPERAPAQGRGNVFPVHLAFGEVGVYPLVTAFLAVVGVYFVAWIHKGGAEEISRFFLLH
jgi:hypothetical protein